MMDRERLGNAIHNPEGSWATGPKSDHQDAQNAHFYVYNRRQESGKDAIPLQAHRERSPRRPYTMQPHDPLADNTYMPSTTHVILHDVPDHNEAGDKTGNPGITPPEGNAKPCGRPDRTFDCWCLNCE